ncbi:MAG TPA: hypothetical protein VFH51_20865, partial [Myxococcota bacterium]|nr:hypothetical protein [Myxococcota bacterium]
SSGAGFPHATQVSVEVLIDLARRVEDAGAQRLTLYDTNGSADPFETRDRVGRVCAAVRIPVFFHGHNDLGLATANALAAVEGGATGLDVTVNGLGDRAGNVSLEQIVILLRLRGWASAVSPASLRHLCRLVEAESQVAISPLAPVVGESVFQHQSPAHHEAPGEFEAYEPRLVGGERRIVG